MKWLKKFGEVIYYKGTKMEDNGTIISHSVTDPVTGPSNIHNSTINLNSDFDNGITATSANITGTLTVNGQDVGEFMNEMKERMLILEPDFKKHEKYPALQEAYEHYKTIEALLKDN